jgi:hypothetical protein
MVSGILITALIVVAILLVAAFFLAKRFLWLAINSVIGLFALMGWNLLFTPVVINFWSVILVALFGIFGLIAVVVLHFLGVAF